MGMLGSTLLSVDAKASPSGISDSQALGRLVKTERKGKMVCKIYQNGNLSSTRCESRSAFEIPEKAKLIRKFKNKDADCETRELNKKKWTRCVTKSAATKITEAKVLRTFKRGLQECTVTRRGAIDTTKCVWTDIMKDAKIIKRFKDGRNRCVVWKSAKAVRKVCEPMGQTVVRKYKDGKGESCTVFRKEHDQWTRCIAPGTFNKVIKRFSRNGSECTNYQRGNVKFTRCTKKPKQSLKGAKVIQRYLKNNNICTKYKKGISTFTRCAPKKITSGRVVRIWMRQGQKCTMYQRGLRQWTRCNWIGTWSGAKVQRRFKRKEDNCTVWEKNGKTRTVCWSSKNRLIRNFVRNGRKCKLLVRPGFRVVRCSGAADGKVVRKFNHQGQKCTTYANGLQRWTRCAWGKDFPNAKIVKKFTQGLNRCTTWQSGSNLKNVCWNQTSKVVRRFLRNGRRCAIWEKAGKQWVRCAQGAVQGTVVKKFDHQGRTCTTYARGDNQWTRCHWEGDMKGAKFIRRFNEPGKKCNVFQKGKV
jgi:hypothetical protein